MEILTGEGENKRRQYLYPFPCNTDETVLEAMEDCHRNWQTFMMFTSGGTGKTSIVSSYIEREFTFFPRSYSLVTASTKVPADSMMKMIEDSIAMKPNALRHELYPYNKFEYLASQFRRKDGTVDAELSYNSVIEKLIFGDNSGAARSKRPTLMAFEEIGNWVGGASFLDCFNASMARGQIGGEASCFYMAIGTGGHTRNDVIKDVKEMIDKPGAYNIYLCDPWGENKKSIFFIPCYKKKWGLFEKTGIMDEITAKEFYDNVRKEKEVSYKALLTQKREFPYTLEECFLKEVTGGMFYPDKLEEQFRRLQNREKHNIPKPMRGWWKPNLFTGYPDWVESTDGPVTLYEQPIRKFPSPGEKQLNLSAHLDGIVPDQLYVAGYDGIDQTKKESQTNNGSKGALWIKRRTGSVSMGGNVYVAKINWRPENSIDELNDQVMYTTMAFNAKINIEFTKFSSVRHFEKNGQKHRLMRRPKSMQGNKTGDQMTNDNLIGTLATPSNINYGIQLLQSYVYHYWEYIYDEEFLTQLSEFSFEEKGKFDLVMAALWTEVADEDVPIYVNRNTFNEKVVNLGYYIDPMTGFMKYGQLPEYMSVTSADFLKYNNPYNNPSNNNVYDNPMMIDPHLYSNAS